MRLLNFTVVKFCLALILGILANHYLKLRVDILFLIEVGLITLLIIQWLVYKSKVVQHIWFGLVTFLVMAGLGMISYGLQDERVNSNHYSHAIQVKDRIEKTFVVQIHKQLKTDAYNDKYVVKVLHLENKSATGQLLLNVSRDSLKRPFHVDDVLAVRTQLQDIRPALNPYQFDYSQYLKRQNIYHQLYASHNDISILKQETHTLFGYADALRRHILLKLETAGFKGANLDLVSALLLGQRQYVDQDVIKSFVDSGTIHILAISGLHVGLILLILNRLFQPLHRIKGGKTVASVLIVVLLWSFAVVAGLSPSVVRAVTMFSLISVALHLRKSTNIYNTLIISAFILLLIRPNFLFEVGFQLSYGAVLGIVSLQPYFYKLWNPPHYFLDLGWQTLTVTVAAQLSILPISLFYFHQFPGLFFVSNLVIIPFLGIILGLGILVILLAVLDLLPEFLLYSYDNILTGLRHFITWVAQFESFLFKDIPFSWLQVLAFYIVLISLFHYFRVKHLPWLYMTFCGIMLFQMELFLQYNTAKEQKFIVFNRSRHTIIGEQRHKTLFIYHDLDSTQMSTTKLFSQYKVGAFIKTFRLKPLEKVYDFQDQLILVVDSLGIYEPLRFQPRYVLLTQSPDINLERLISRLQPQLIIADASNYKSYVRRWQSTCKKQKLPFHYTNEKGALILKNRQ